jgi:hypothetical protein
MNAVDPHGVERMKIPERFPVCTCKRHVVPDRANRTACFNAADHIALRQVLMLEAHLGRSKDARFCKAAPHALR